MDKVPFDIMPGRKYLIAYGDCEVQVETVRPSAVKGWWFCVTGEEREQAVFPETAFVREIAE
jgi:hypothetical protein